MSSQTKTAGKSKIAPNYVMKATCTKVLDGDTVILTVSPAFNVYHQGLHFRLKGINTPELKDANPKIRTLANKAKKFLTDAILGKEILLETIKTKSTGQKLDKYGRYLAIIYAVDAEGVQYCVNEVMVARGLAVPFME